MGLQELGSGTIVTKRILFQCKLLDQCEEFEIPAGTKYPCASVVKDEAGNFRCRLIGYPNSSLWFPINDVYFETDS